MNNNSGTITNDFSDNRISFQSGSNVYNFNNQGGKGNGKGTPMSNLTMAQVAQGEDIADNMKYTVAASAVNNNCKGKQTRDLILLRLLLTDQILLTTTAE